MDDEASVTPVIVAAAIVNFAVFEAVVTTQFTASVAVNFAVAI